MIKAVAINSFDGLSDCFGINRLSIICLTAASERMPFYF